MDFFLKLLGVHGRLLGTIEYTLLASLLLTLTKMVVEPQVSGSSIDSNLVSKSKGLKGSSELFGFDASCNQSVNARGGNGFSTLLSLKQNVKDVI